MNIKLLTIIAILSASALCLCSCQKEGFRFREGDAVRFSVGSAGTKAAYSGEGGGTVINWQVGDTLRIYCAAVSEPSTKYADYKVSSLEDPPSKARIAGLGGVGLRWGTGEHTFYAVYPSPEDGGVTASVSIGEYADGGTKASVSRSISGATVTAKLPASQRTVSMSNSGVNYVAAPDFKNMLMTAKSNTYTEDTGITDEVFLSFIPLTTAVQFTITNQTKAELAIKSVSLTSASSALNGKFSVDIDNTSTPSPINFGNTTVTYHHPYPACTYTGSVNDATRTVTINFASPIVLSYNADPAQSGTLTFTFFLQPCQDFDDLSFSFAKSDGSTLSTRIGYLDGTGVLFPHFMKSTVNGVFIPEGAQWTVKYTPDVVSWNAGGNTPINPMPEVNEDITLVTSWHAGVNEPLELKEQPDYLPGIFTISAGADEIAGTDDDVKVRFSKGNLIATVDATGTPTAWRFHDNQYDYLGTGGANTTIGTGAGDVDLFGWSIRSRSDYGINKETFLSIGTSDGFLDWGTAIDSEGTWYTLNVQNWLYLLGSNPIRDGLSSYGVTVVGKANCLILYPDGYDSNVVPDGDITTYDTAEKWAAAEREGVVCLPAAGQRAVSTISNLGESGKYQMANIHDSFGCLTLSFSDEKVDVPGGAGYATGCSVRLVTDAN